LTTKTNHKIRKTEIKMRKYIEKSIITFANLIKDKGLFKAIQFVLYGDKKKVSLSETMWY